LIKKSFLYLFVKSKNIKTTSELAKQNMAVGGQIGAILTNNKLYGKELNNERGFQNSENPVKTPIDTGEEIAKQTLIFERLFVEFYKDSLPTQRGGHRVPHVRLRFIHIKRKVNQAINFFRIIKTA